MTRKFREWTPDQNYLFPPSPQDWLPQNHLVCFLLEVSEQMQGEWKLVCLTHNLLKIFRRGGLVAA